VYREEHFVFVIGVTVDFTIMLEYTDAPVRANGTLGAKWLEVERLERVDLGVGKPGCGVGRRSQRR
jgi:hypothetical protein